MKRFLSVWLPRWPIERRPVRGRHWPRPEKGPTGEPAEGHGPRPHEPFVLSSMSENGPRITATNAAADRLGFHAGMPLADARAIFPALAVAPADEEGDARALIRLALWCQCFSPLTRADPPDGLHLDITGCARLFGGEAALADSLAARLAGFGLTAGLAIAPTIGAAWALARYGPGYDTGGRAFIAGASRPLHETLAPLPVAALRLGDDVVAALGRLGLKRIGDLLGKPRAPLAARFGRELADRLDQALGHAGESFEALSAPPVWRVERRFVEPIVTTEAVGTVVDLLAADLACELDREARGVRRLELTLYRVDGWFERLEVRVSAPSREAAHLARLLRERLDGIEDHAGFGFEMMTLGAFDVAHVAPRQAPLAVTRDDGVAATDDPARLATELIAPLVDRLVNRFGPANVTGFMPQASHLPERAARTVPLLHEREGPAIGWPEHARLAADGAAFARPLLLFERPEPVTALFEVPDGPPVRFEWRKVSYRVASADGPERIAPEWWRAPEQYGGAGRLTRDYYRIEDGAGRRFWLYREGLYERDDEDPAWFIHGVFA